MATVTPLAALAAALAMAQAPGTCRIRSVTGLAFGAYDPVGANAAAPLDTTGQISYTCRTTAPLVTLSAGSAGTFNPRLLRSGTATLPYNLYRDAGHAQIWGDGTGGSFTVTAPAGRRLVLVVYGRIPAGRVARPGSYADTVVATFNF